jgi:hypothetical protein
MARLLLYVFFLKGAYTNMSILIICAIAVTAGIFLVVSMLSRDSRPAGDPSQSLRSSDVPTPQAQRFRSLPTLLTNAEASFFGALQLALPEDYHVFSKVRLADVLEPVEKGPSRRQAFNQICSKHIDFLICRAGSWEILAAIELDDSSHLNRDRIKRDEFLAHAFAEAELLLIRIPARHTYSIEDLRNTLKFDPVKQLSALSPTPPPAPFVMRSPHTAPKCSPAYPQWTMSS